MKEVSKCQEKPVPWLSQGRGQDSQEGCWSEEQAWATIWLFKLCENRFDKNNKTQKDTLTLCPFPSVKKKTYCLLSAQTTLPPPRAFDLHVSVLLIGTFPADLSSPSSSGSWHSLQLNILDISKTAHAKKKKKKKYFCLAILSFPEQADLSEPKIRFAH